MFDCVCVCVDLGVSTVPEIVYGYGGNEDDKPYEATVDLVSSLVSEYVLGMTSKAVDLAYIRGGLDEDCFLQVCASHLLALRQRGLECAERQRCGTCFCRASTRMPACAYQLGA